MFSEKLQVIEQFSRQVLSVVLNTSLKGLMIVICVYLVLLCLKKTHSQTLHLVWFLSIACFIILPFLSLLIQPVTVAALRVPEDPGRAYQTIASVVSIDQSPAGSMAVIQPQPTGTAGPLRPFFGMFRWTFLFTIWLTGVFGAFLRLYNGNVKARKIVKNSEIVKKEEMVSLLGALCEQNDISASIYLCSSKRYGSPFTIGVFNPAIVLPEHMVCWPTADIEPVLLHELHHIKRKDYLTQTTAMVICSIFWFIPVLWLAFKKLYTEQENACDAGVLLCGIRPQHYAKQMLRLACAMVSPTASPGLFMVSGRRKFFERRIKNILEMRGAIMKKSSLIFVAVGFTLVLLLAAGCLTPGKAVSEEEFFASWTGTWVNTETPGDWWVPQKIVSYPDGSWDIHTYATDRVNFCHHEMNLTDLWTDSKDIIWFKANGICPDKGIEGSMYGKIGNSGNTLEYLYNLDKENPIEKWDPENPYLYYCSFDRE
jgi:beta-lactamase regulating signal transducer with metallopeptidase domain